MTPTSYVEFRNALDSGRVTCVEETSAFLSRIRSSDLNAFLCVDEAGALARAAEIDALERNQRDMLPLAGMVVGVKDVINSSGLPMTCGSRILEGFDSLFDATVVERLRAAGAIIIGKLNCDEFAMGSSNENSAFGAVRNPVSREHVPGGSSGGSAAAVGANLCHVALGSDTGGSIRQPASFCGVVGLKPTYGRVSRFGLVAFASSLDSIGPLARTIDDAELVLAAISGRDERDATSLPLPVHAAEVLPRRIGIPKEYFGRGTAHAVHPEIVAAIESARSKFEQSGIEVVEVSLPHTEYGVAAYYIVASAEASSNLARFDGVRYGYRADAASIAAEVDDDDLSPLDAMYTATRTAGFGEEVKRRIMLGTYALSSGYYDAYYDKAQRVRTLIRRDFEHAFADVDVLLAPVSPTPAFRLGERIDDVLAMYLVDVFTVPSSLAGIPGLSVPMGATTEGLPIGVQLLGPSFSETTLFAAGRILSPQ